MELSTGVIILRILISEDDADSRMFISKLMTNYGICDLAVDGIEAIEAFIMALDLGKPYDLICLDVIMPKVDGIKAIKIIREIEQLRHIYDSERVKIIITTALGKTNYVMSAFETGLVAYISKPFEQKNIETAIKMLGLL